VLPGQQPSHVEEVEVVVVVLVVVAVVHECGKNRILLYFSMYICHGYMPQHIQAGI
jgi:hypothetical protein